MWQLDDYYNFVLMSRFDKYRKLPVYKKAEELAELVEAISAAIKDGSQKEYYERELIGNSYVVQAKIAGAEGGGLYLYVCKML